MLICVGGLIVIVCLCVSVCALFFLVHVLIYYCTHASSREWICFFPLIIVVVFICVCAHTVHVCVTLCVSPALHTNIEGASSLLLYLQE